VAKVSDRSARYYLDGLGDELARAGAAHRDDGGRWVGRGSAWLGLAGPVGGAALQGLLGGLHPGTGRPLVAVGRRPVAGFDLVFTAPKSVSVLLALGPPESTDQVMAAHRDAVGAAVEHLERRAWAVRRGTGADRRPIPSDGVVAAGFTHCLSRAGDPHLHTHVVAANLAHGTDGRWSALDSRGPFAHARAAGAVYDAHLRAELSDRLGVSWSWGAHGWGIEGTDPLLTAAFSNRAAEIRQEVAVRGLGSAKAKRVAWTATRDPKDPGQSRADLAASWSRRASIAPEPRFEYAPDPRGSGPIDEHRFASTIASCPPAGVCRRDVVEAWAGAVSRGLRAGDVERAVDHWVPGTDDEVGVAEQHHAPASCVPAPHLISALGPRPAGAEGQPVWRHAAAAIDRYRMRWGVGEAGVPGAGPERLAGLPHRRLAEHIEVARTVRDARMHLGGRALTSLEREGRAMGR
jgi:conjugative relaxase-like TrwC/TraI family protein